MELDYLADHPDHLPVLAQWHHDEWSYMRPGDTVDARMERMHKLCGHDAIPSIIIAHEAGQLLGSAMLIHSDMDSRPDLTPWLAGVYVYKDFRRQGIGRALVQRVMQLANELHVPTLYLFTPDQQQFYANIGWQHLEQTNYRGVDVSIMSVHPSF